MAFWPFGRKRKERPVSTASRTGETTATKQEDDMDENMSKTPGPGGDPKEMDNHVSSAAGLAGMESRRSIQMGGIGNNSDPNNNGVDEHQVGTPIGIPIDIEDQDQPPRQNSVQDITALPGLRKLESSPHLRPVDPDRPVIPYTLNLNRPSAARLGFSAPAPAPAPAGETEAEAQAQAHANTSSSVTNCLVTPNTKSTRVTTLHRQASSKKANDRRDKELREEHIRAMSAPMQIPKRPAAVNNDLLRRDSKKARRTLSKPRPDDPRASNVSLPVSVPSIMSARSEHRGWLVGGMDLLNPRPTVHYQSINPAAARNPPNKGKMPAIPQDSAASHRRRIADLADDLDSTSLRAVMERDARRQEQKMNEQHDRLERKLRKRAEKQRAEEEKLRVEKQRADEEKLRIENQRADEENPRADHLSSYMTLQHRGRDMERRPVDALQPTAVHPAFRDIPNVSVIPLTPRSIIDEKPAPGGTYPDPFGHPAPEATTNPFADSQPDNSESWSPVQTPLEEPVLHTARAVNVRLSQGHMSPPDSPLIAITPSSAAPLYQSDAQTRRTSKIKIPTDQPRRTSESSPRRTGTWAAIFRRGANNSRTSVEIPAKQVTTESSFANVSRESMSRSAIPAHLVRQLSNHAGASGRTQSRFREDLPDVPMSPPDSRVQSPEMSIAAANAASARRLKPKAVPTGPSSPGYGPETYLARTDSPVVSGPQIAEAPLSQSLASVDSEGSWISGRPPIMQRRSTRRVTRGSTTRSVSPVSMDVADNDFTVSYEQLPVPDHELFKSLTPGSTSKPVPGVADPRPGLEATSASDGNVEPTEGGLPVRRGTAHRQATLVHNDPRFRSREGLVAQFSGAMPLRRRSSSFDSNEYNTPAEETSSPAILQKATSINYGQHHGHAKTMSAGSAKLLTISPRGTPAPSPKPHQTEFP